jgi:hypothetical protein
LAVEVQFVKAAIQKAWRRKKRQNPTNQARSEQARDSYFVLKRSTRPAS